MSEDGLGLGRALRGHKASHIHCIVSPISTFMYLQIDGSTVFNNFARSDANIHVLEGKSLEDLCAPTLLVDRYLQRAMVRDCIICEESPKVMIKMGALLNLG